jgi:predicted acylesterase/phospholipase RssA
MTARLRVLAASAAFLMSACSTAPPRSLSDEVPEGVYLVTGARPADEQVDPRFAEVGLFGYIEQLRGRPLQVLELSGGGQYGAFGAGFLKGWSAKGTRPEFDMVTGVSTGALLATQAFLGTPADDAVLEEIFTGVTQEDIYTRRILGTAFGAPSVFDTTPLRNLIARHITPQVLERVAAESAKGRRLAVAATNIDRNQFWVFSLSEIAMRGGPGALELYRDALLASASPPIAFPPVEIAGSLFVDGSVRENVLVVGMIGRGSDIGNASGAARGNVYLIQNGRLKGAPRAVRADVVELAGATFEVISSGRMGITITRAYAATRLHGYDFNLVSIPPDVEISGNALAFDQQEMRRVFDAGYHLAQQPDPWLHEPPTNDQTSPWARELIRRLGELN